MVRERTTCKAPLTELSYLTQLRPTKRGGIIKSFHRLLLPETQER